MGTVCLLITSVFSVVLQNCLYNNSCKKTLKTVEQINLFYVFVYSACILIFGALLFTETISLYTAILGFAFGVITTLSNTYKLLSLSSGPMNITLLITTSSMIIPTLSGIFFGERFSPIKLIVVFVLIGFIYLSTSKKSDLKATKKWLIYCALAFVFQGLIGVTQKIHQSSAHKTEAAGFLFVSFLFALVLSILRNKGLKKEIKIGKKTALIAMVCGVCTFSMNYINLKLSGMLPSQLVFPLINGSVIILSSLASIIIFKEKLSKRQAVGLVGGIASLIAICLVP